MPANYTLAILTSGGDAPGMNAAVRAVARMALDRGCDVIGVQRGYTGLMRSHFADMDVRSVAGILDKGGTLIGTSRSLEFMTAEGRAQAVRNVRAAGIDGLVVIGGNGSLTGAQKLHELGVPVVGLPASIDNDLTGTDMAIGVDTCLNTILHAMDNLRDTAISHNRAFIIEVMGRNCGYLAVHAALNSGAGVVIVPEIPVTLEEVGVALSTASRLGKTHFMVVVAEGAQLKAAEIAAYLHDSDSHHYEARITILGHVQRGGSPTAADRNLATRLGAAAVNALLDGRSGVMLGLIDGQVAETSLADVVRGVRPLDTNLYDLVRVMNH